MRLERVLAPTIALAGALLLPGRTEAAVWQVPRDFPSIQAAIDSSLVKDGDTIDVQPGARLHGATVTKAVTIRGIGNPTIVNGPVVNALGRAGFLFPGEGAGSGATITGLGFWGVAFPVFSRGADDVSVTGNTMRAPIQGVTNWANGSWGNGWDITGNTILDLRASCGGGIGILVGDYAGATVTDNLIAHNEVRGLVYLRAGRCGGYSAPGIVLFADFRYPGDRGATIERNRVAKNRVSLASNDPERVPVAGVELTDTRNLASEIVIRSNAVVYNDLRGMDVPVSLMPDELAPPQNRIEANLTGPLGGWPDAHPRGTGAGPAPVR